MLGVLKELYKIDKDSFKLMGLILMFHYMAIGLVTPYTLLIQLRFVTLSTIMILNGVGFIVGTALLYSFLKGKALLKSVKNRLIIFKSFLWLGRASIIGLLLVGKDSPLTIPLLLMSVIGGTFTYPTINTDTQYLVFKSYKLQHRAKLTSVMSILFNVMFITMSLVSSVLYPNLLIVYTLALLFDGLAILLITSKVKGEFGYSAIKSIRKTLNYSEHIILLALLLIMVSSVLIGFIRPIVFKTVSESSVGYLFSINGLITAIMLQVVFPRVTKIGHIIYRTILILVSSIVLLIGALINPTISVISIMLTIPLLTIGILGLRHNLFKGRDSTYTWTITGLNELLRSIPNILLVPFSFIPGINSTIILGIVIALNTGAVLLLGGIHRRNPGFVQQV